MHTGTRLPTRKGEGESGTVAYTAICSPWNFRGLNLIGMLLNWVVALHRWLEVGDSDSIIPLAPL